MSDFKPMVKLAAAISLTLLLQACAAAVVAGGASAVTSASDRRTLGSQIDDGSIVVKAERALEANKALDEQAHINVNSYNGILLLTNSTGAGSGVVDIRTGAELALNGGLTVANNLTVAGSGPGRSSSW